MHHDDARDFERFSRNLKKTLLTNLAKNMLSTECGTISEVHVRNCLRQLVGRIGPAGDVLACHWQNDDDDGAFDLESIIGAIVNQLKSVPYIILFVGGTSFAFLNRTFHEYFIASAIMDTFDAHEMSVPELVSYVCDRVIRPGEREVILLLCGMMVSSVMGRCIAAFLRLDDSLLLFAALCLDQLKDKQDARDISDTVRTGILTVIRNSSDADAVANALEILTRVMPDRTTHQALRVCVDDMSADVKRQAMVKIIHARILQVWGKL